MCKIMCKERGAKFFTIPKEYAGDNGAMIAWCGILSYESGKRMEVEDTTIKQKWRTDDVEVGWR